MKGSKGKPSKESKVNLIKAKEKVRRASLLGKRVSSTSLEPMAGVLKTTGGGLMMIPGGGLKLMMSIKLVIGMISHGTDMIGMLMAGRKIR